MKIPTLTLKKNKESSILRRHPWIFSGALQNPDEKLHDGTVVRLAQNSGGTLGYGFFLPGSLRIKLFSFTTKSKVTIEELLSENFIAAIALRKSLGLFSSLSTNCFRLVNAEGDSLPGLIIDLYNGIAVIQLHHVGWVSYLDLLVTQLVKHAGCRGVYLKTHEKIEGRWLTAPQENPVIVTEHGVQFSVNYIDGQKTGFFLDQRENRKCVGQISSQRTVLNLFAYTGGFSMYALRGGAKNVHSVDVSENACTGARENAALNGFSDSHRVSSEDCFKLVEKLSPEYDLVICDPPALTKHKDSVSQAVKGYRHLNRSILKALPPHGLLATFSCSQLVSREQFESIIFSTAVETDRTIKIVTRFVQAPCHPTSVYHLEGLYLKGLLLEVL